MQPKTELFSKSCGAAIFPAMRLRAKRIWRLPRCFRSGAAATPHKWTGWPKSSNQICPFAYLYIPIVPSMQGFSVSPPFSLRLFYHESSHKSASTRPSPLFSRHCLYFFSIHNPPSVVVWYCAWGIIRRFLFFSSVPKPTGAFQNGNSQPGFELRPHGFIVVSSVSALNSVSISRTSSARLAPLTGRIPGIKAISEPMMINAIPRTIWPETAS